MPRRCWIASTAAFFALTQATTCIAETSGSAESATTVLDRTDLWCFFSSQWERLAPPPSLVKCVGATVAGSIFAILGTFLDNRKDARRRAAAEERTLRKRGVGQRASAAPVEGALPVIGEASQEIVPSRPATAWSPSIGRPGGREELSPTQLVERQVKSILNKLTRERFAILYDQLLRACCEDDGTSVRPHVIEIIAKEVFVKATIQHSFVEMYAEVCAKLHLDLTRKGAASSFKRVLLEQCRRSFNLYLDPPPVNTTLDYEEQYEATVKYKTQMIGNARLIGHLLRKRMLSLKVIFHCAEELLAIGSAEALETLCALLETVGNAWDLPEERAMPEATPSPAVRPMIDDLFSRLELLVEDPQRCPRVRCLLGNLLEKRRNHWREWSTSTSTSNASPARHSRR